MPTELVDAFIEGGEAKRQATTALMTFIEEALGAVTVSAPDYATLEFFWTLRRLVKSGAGCMSISQQVEFARTFSTANPAVLQHPRVQAMREMTADYNAALKSFGLRDYQVSQGSSPTTEPPSQHSRACGSTRKPCEHRTPFNCTKLSV